MIRFLYGSKGTSSAPSPEYVRVGDGDEDSFEELWMVTSKVSLNDNERPITSKPGPMLALVAGTLILNFRSAINKGGKNICKLLNKRLET